MDEEHCNRLLTHVIVLIVERSSWTFFWLIMGVHWSAGMRDNWSLCAIKKFVG